jgi:hypothetical protein
MATTKIRSSSILDGQVANADLSATVAVTGGQIADDAITLAKMAGLVRGKIIVGDASGDPSALTVGGASTVLTSDGTDATWAAAAAGGNTHSSQWRLTASFTSSLVPIVSNWAAVIASAPRTTTVSPDGDTALGAPMDVDGSGFWTFPSTGWWNVEFVTAFLPTAYSSSPSGGYINYADDGTTFVKVTKENGTQEGNYAFNSINSILLKIEVTTTDKVTFGFYSPGAITCNASGTENYTYATFTRLGDI